MSISESHANEQMHISSVTPELGAVLNAIVTTLANIPEGVDYLEKECARARKHAEQQAEEVQSQEDEYDRRMGK